MDLSIPRSAKVQHKSAKFHIEDESWGKEEED